MKKVSNFSPSALQKIQIEILVVILEWI